jgi:hypothetical protein
MAEAEGFTTLFERGPDDRPMDGLIHWLELYTGTNV